MKRKQKHPDNQRAGGQGGSSTGSVWLSRDEMNHMKWYQEVMNSKKNRGDHSRINLD